MSKQLRLYGFEGCPYCEELREYFDKDGLDYTYVDINLPENEAETKKVMEVGKTDSVPIVLVAKTILAPEISFTSIPEAFQITKKLLSE